MAAAAVDYPALTTTRIGYAAVADAAKALTEIDRLRHREDKLNRIERAFEDEKAAKSAYEAHPNQEMFARWGIARQALTNALEGKT